MTGRDALRAQAASEVLADMLAEADARLRRLEQADRWRQAHTYTPGRAAEEARRQESLDRLAMARERDRD